MTGALAITRDGIVHGQIIATYGDWSVAFRPTDSTDAVAVAVGDYIADTDCDDPDRAKAFLRRVRHALGGKPA